MKNKNVFLKISILINLIMIFFGYFITNLYYLQFIGLTFTLLHLILNKRTKKISVKKDSFIWCIFILYLILFLVISIDIKESILIIVLLSSSLLIKLIYENYTDENLKKYTINLIILFGSTHIFATILQLLFPEFIGNINKIILSSDEYVLNLQLYSRGAYAGITGQTGVNAFYISLFILSLFSSILFEKKKKTVTLILLIIGILCLFLTGKRSLLLFSLLTMFIVFFKRIKLDKKNKIKYIFIILAIILGVYFILNTIPETSVVFDKFNTLSEQDDVFNGRYFLWEKTFSIFKENYLSGIGIGTIITAIGEYSHNVYIELLAETGIMGFIIYILALLYTLKNTFNALKKDNNIEFMNNKCYLYLSLSIQLLFILYSFFGNALYSQIFVLPYFISTGIFNLSEED